MTIRRRKLQQTLYNLDICNKIGLVNLSQKFCRKTFPAERKKLKPKIEAETKLKHHWCVWAVDLSLLTALWLYACMWAWQQDGWVNWENVLQSVCSSLWFIKLLHWWNVLEHDWTYTFEHLNLTSDLPAGCKRKEIHKPQQMTATVFLLCIRFLLCVCTSWWLLNGSAAVMNVMTVSSVFLMRGLI